MKHNICGHCVHWMARDCPKNSQCTDGWYICPNCDDRACESFELDNFYKNKTEKLEVNRELDQRC